MGERDIVLYEIIIATGNFSAQNLQFTKVSEDFMDSFIGVRHFFNNTVICLIVNTVDMNYVALYILPL